MKLPTSLKVALSATAALWVVALLAYAFGQRTEIIVAAFVLGCVTAWIEIMKQVN